MNTMRMPAAQTLLLFAHAIDTNGGCSKIVCDSWLCLEFPQPESGIVLLQKACQLRRLWNRLLDQRLEGECFNIITIPLSFFNWPVYWVVFPVLTKSVDSEVTKPKRDERTEKMENELWLQLANFMNTEVYYTIKRLLPADLKGLYCGATQEDVEEGGGNEEFKLDTNPFAEDFECQQSPIKGGLMVTENVTINW